MTLTGATLWVIPILVTFVSTAQGVSYLGYSASITCSGSTCGLNARCTTSGGRPVCSCLPGYEGDPLGVCRKLECTNPDDCSPHLTCSDDNRCIDPCEGVCGTNANCEVRNHRPTCSCPPHHTGNPYTGCKKQLCHPSPCGLNTKCDIINEVPTCSCLPGYFGNPLSGCRHECDSDSDCGSKQHCRDFKCVNPCNQCGINAECEVIRNHIATCKCPNDYFGDPYRSCQPECRSDSECPSNKPACVSNKCADPCIGACGYRALCDLRGRTPICSCPRNMTGNPFESCRPFEKKDLCVPNPCGINALCQPGFDNNNRERPVCTCPPGHFGNALVSCTRGECETDDNCPLNKACEGYNCINPCRGQCGAGAECQPRQHIAVCVCPDGTQGDALLACSTKRNQLVSRYFRFY